MSDSRGVSAPRLRGSHRFLSYVVQFPGVPEILHGRGRRSGDTAGVSVQHAAAQIVAAVTRARSLFASSPQPPPGAGGLDVAAHSTVTAGQRAAVLSGVLADRHGDFVGEQAARLTDAAETDTRLASQLDRAAMLTRTGARQLDVIVEQTRSLARTAAGARNPADQRMMLAALKSRLSAANAVVSSTQQQAAGIAGQIRSLDYHPGKHDYAAVRGADYAEDGGPKPQPDDPDGEDGKGRGKSWSKGKGSNTHIHPHGEPEKQWGHPTNPHEAWPDVPKKTGTFDGDHGKWEWHGPGRQGGADASQTTDGVTGKAGVDAWGVKGDGHWSGDVFGHPLDSSASGEIGAHAGADGTLTKHGISLGADAFAGGEIEAKGDYHLGPVDLSLGGAAQLGAGGSAHLDFGMEDGKLVFGGTLGAAMGPGAKISPHIAVDPKAVLGGLQKAGQWLDDLFK